MGNQTDDAKKLEPELDAPYWGRAESYTQVFLALAPDMEAMDIDPLEACT